MEMGFRYMEGESSSEKKVLRVLVVDDDDVIRHIHVSLLRKMNAEVEAAENGMAAVDAFKSGASFDLVLMDLEMPVMDGVQATMELRRMGVGSKIIGVSASDPSSEKEAALVEAGLDACLKKPLTDNTLEFLLRRFKK